MNLIRKCLGLCVHQFEVQGVQRFTRISNPYGVGGGNQLTRVLSRCPTCGKTKIEELPGWWDLEHLASKD